MLNQSHGGVTDKWQEGQEGLDVTGQQEPEVPQAPMTGGDLIQNDCLHGFKRGFVEKPYNYQLVCSFNQT